jgi:hypothetical protein
MTTKDERYRRIGILERAISERGWSLQLERVMATEFSCSTRTIRRYRDDLVSCYRKELAGQDLEDARAEFLLRLRGHQRHALSSGRHGPLASMMGIELRVLGLDKGLAEIAPSPVQVILRVPASGSTPNK